MIAALKTVGLAHHNAQLFAALLLGLPLLGSVICMAAGMRCGRRFINATGAGSIGAAFVVALLLLQDMLERADGYRSTTVTLWQWLDLGRGNLQVNVAVTLDQLSMVMVLVITGVGFLIHVYATGYMEHDETPQRFFAYMNFFVFSMLLLVLSADLIILIIGWALVALSSYLLIGYYYDRPSAVLAARKAFITQVIGDVALVIAAFMIFTNLRDYDGATLRTLDMATIFQHAASFPSGGAAVTGICILLAIGAFAKSAQFPLHTWLPDAMEGPTPVSALIHAATMVTAGVYLIARFHPLFDRAWFAQDVVAWVGMLTALMAGIIALSQIDIKRVIAYSTMSQIGLMIFAVGIGAYTAGMYHFVTHAVFKALLFMAAGNVIHALHDEQDIRIMGGMRRAMKWTAIWFMAGSLSLAGFIGFAGFFSKEYLLGFGFGNGPFSSVFPILYVVGLVINVLTGLYAMRLYFTVFEGEPETAAGWAAHEAPRSMLYPVGILGAGAVVLGWFLLWPIGIGSWHPQALGDFLAPVFTQSFSGRMALESASATRNWAVLLGGTLASLIGVGGGINLWLNHQPDAGAIVDRLPRFLPQLSLHRFYFDELYDAMVVRPTLAVSRACRRVMEPKVMDGWTKSVVGSFRYLSDVARDYQTGLIRDYASYMTIGAVLFMGVIFIANVVQHP